MHLNIRSYQKELLDQEDISDEALAQNLRELAFINQYSGGHNVTLKGIETLLLGIDKNELTIVDLGSGGGDTLLAIARWARKKEMNINLLGVDYKTECINFAKKAAAGYPEISFIHSDYRAIAPEEFRADIIISSLFCHHLTNKEIVELLVWMQQHSRIGFVINDLHRHYLAYKSISFLTHLFSKSYLVKNDAKLSVARGFLRAEWQQLLNEAGIKDSTLTWEWAFRHLIISRNGSN